MQTKIEHLAENSIRMTITVSEEEFEKSIDQAFKTLAKQVRLPGFRPGKAPRKILEQQIGLAAGREQALNDSIGEYYVQAIDENDIDPIDYPEIKLISGQEEGEVVFEALVDVRPVVKITGYDKLEVVVDVPAIDEEGVNRQLDLLRDRFAELEAVEGKIEDGHFVTIDLSGSIDGEEEDGLSADDYLYEVGSALISEKMDEALRGKKVGDEATFTDELSENFGPLATQEAEFKITIKEVQAKNLPEATDEWIKENTEFETRETYDADVLKRLENLRSFQAQMQLKQNVINSLADLVEDELPEKFVQREVDARIEQMAAESKISTQQIAEVMETWPEDERKDFMENVKKDAENAIKSDLAIRAVMVQEAIEANDTDVEEEIVKYSQSSGEKINKVRNRLAKPGVEKQIRQDIARNKAVEFVLENAVAKDKDGNIIDIKKADLSGDENTVLNNVMEMISASATDHSGHDHDHADHDHDHSDPNHVH
jgi:trigger factor